MKFSKGKISNYCLHKIIFALLVLFIHCHKTLATESPASQDICQQIDSNFRAFGNTCHDHCLPQFNKSQPCFNIISFGCDCGENSCLFDGECITKIEFSKIYKKIEDENHAKIINYNNTLIKKFNFDSQYSYYLRNIYKEPARKLNSEPSIAQKASNDFLRNAQQYVNQQNSQNQQNQNTNATNNNNVSKVINIVADDSKNQGSFNNQIPQFYIDRQKSKENDGETKAPDSSEIESILPIVPIIAP